MLRTIGVQSIDDLFADIPEDARHPEIKLPPALSEPELLSLMQCTAGLNADVASWACFRGAGVYNHFVPATVPHLIFRSEFYTAYTPYQAEISQGTLQTIFEYQSMICDLTGMDAANASHYDGATATAEAAILAVNSFRDRDKIIVAPTLHPESRATLRTYLAGQNIPIVGDEDPAASLESILDKHLDNQTAGVIVQNPDFLGELRMLEGIAERVHKAGALFIVSAYPISLGLLTPPGEYGADVAVGEGQSLGNPIAFGGPYLGIFACKEKHIRRMAGRLIGQTVDTAGRQGYVLTLQAREQHIRRDKATSNICTNEALNALAASVYLATMGKQGLRKVAELCYQKAHYAAAQIAQIPGYRIGNRAFFNEFVVHCPRPVGEINQALRAKRVIGGFELGSVYPHLKDAMLLAVTEMNSRAQIDLLVSTLRGI